MSSSPCSSSSTSQVIVDDRDPRITYCGTWTSDRGEGSSRWGDSFNDTTHRSTLGPTSSNFTFSFTGTAFSIIGDIESLSTANSSSTSAREVLRGCVVDGQEFTNAVTYGSNILCGADGLSDTNHEVTFTSHASSTSKLVMYVDAIQYTPSNGTDTTTNTTKMVGACDTSISYGNDISKWSAFDAPVDSGLADGTPQGFETRFKGVSTNQPGTQLTYTFEGTLVKWLSTIPSANEAGSSSSKAASASFELHTSDSRVLNWTVSLAPALTNQTQYNFLTTQTPDLPQGTHKLIATYTGDTSSVPLSLSYFYVYGSTTGTSAPSQGALSQSSSHLGAIIGGAVGGFFGLLLVLSLVWVFYQRKQRKVESRAWDVVWKNRNSRTLETLEMGAQKSKKFESA